MKFFLTVVLFIVTFCIQAVASPSKSNVLTNVDTEFNIIWDWGTGFQAEIVLTNKGKSNINGWFVEFDLPKEITHIWNAEAVSSQNNHYVLKNKNYNAILKPNRSIYIGIQGNPGNVTAPASLVVKDSIEQVPEEIDCSVAFNVTSDWHSAFNAIMTITNNGSKDITGWTLEFDFAHCITIIWDAAVQVAEKNGKYYHYKLKNLDYNVIIPAGKSVTFGFTAKPGHKISDPFNIKISGKDPNSGGSDTVILVYKTLVRAYVHRKIGKKWKYEGDENKLTYYDVIEFTPATRTYKQAKRVVVNFDGSISKVDGLNFIEYNKEPRDGETEAYMKYLVGSIFESDKHNFGSGEAMYGKVVLAQKSNIGWKEKVAVARSMTGKFNLDSKYTWKNYNYYTRLESKHTKKANEQGLNIDETVSAIVDSLK